MLHETITQLQATEIKQRIDQRLKEFETMQQQPTEVWFNELCFCLLTANAKAKTALAIEQKLGKTGFLDKTEPELMTIIKNNKHRFHNTKAKYIVNARQHKNVKTTIINIIKNSNEASARAWLAENIKGLGYKEASHFLRNIGYQNLAILDRHILNIMREHKIIKKPKTLTKKTYLLIEKKFNHLAKNLQMSSAELDLYLWYIQTGEILK